MLLHLRNAVNPAQLAALLAGLTAAGPDWVDGRVTAGTRGAPVKRNQQLVEDLPSARQLGDIVLAAFERNPQFISATLPNRVYPPMFNRYDSGMAFGDHIDNAVRMVPGSASKLRTDVSVTLFLAAPEDYDGGELLIEDRYGVQSVKLPSGDAIVYPASSLHRVAPVTRGTRLASFFWVQSLVADDARRTLLFDLDQAIQRLAATGADATARTQLTGSYHNLLRMWSQP
jgi:PKHD-type hydroxylase